MKKFMALVVLLSISSVYPMSSSIPAGILWALWHHVQKYGCEQGIANRYSWESFKAAVGLQLPDVRPKK